MVTGHDCCTQQQHFDAPNVYDSKRSGCGELAGVNIVIAVADRQTRNSLIGSDRRQQFVHGHTILNALPLEKRILHTQTHELLRHTPRQFPDDTQTVLIPYHMDHEVSHQFWGGSHA